MPPEPRKTNHVPIILMGIIFLLALFLAWMVTPPTRFAAGAIIEVSEGKGLTQVSEDLLSQEIIRSPLLFKILVVLFGGEHRLKAGQYFFARPATLPIVAWRITRGDHRIATAKLTVPEGFTVEKISKLFDEHFPFFDHTEFAKRAEEGYLFPDTYFVPVTATASSTIKLMRDNFDRKVMPLLPEIKASKHTLAEIIIMASLLEAEAKTKLDREMTSDILWKRLKLGMALQVDSDMGTYEFQGLPDNPINNPGLVSIVAAIHPTSTPYLYFLSGKDGKMHYAKNFDDHQNNITKYLR